MPNILILGATGYVGLPLAQSLLRAGTYNVWGLARTPEKAKILTANEITPILGDAADASKLTDLIASASIDIVIDATSAYDHNTSVLEALKTFSKNRIVSLAKEGITAAPKLAFVYTSGAWVHGEAPYGLNDLAPIGSKTHSKGTPATISNWRVGHEQAVLASADVLDVAIVRPVEIYGRSSWLFTPWLGPLHEAVKSGSTDPVKIPATHDARASLIHVDDVVSGFHAVVDRIHGGLGSWPVFDLGAETVEGVAIMEAVREAMGIKAELEWAGPRGDVMHQAMTMKTSYNGSRARIVLNWEPKRRDFLANVPIFVKAWQAAQ